MTAHLLVLYPNPTDEAEFDRAYREKHLPYGKPRLVAEGATMVETKKVVGPGFAPPPYHWISDITFPSLEALQAAAGSTGGQEALANAASISTGGAPMLMVVVQA